MPWKNVYAPDNHIIHVHVSGLVDRPQWEKLLQSSLKEAALHSCYCFLVDYREAELRLGLLDLYDRPSYYEKVGMPHNARIALLFAPSAKDTDFIETVTSNRGYSVRVFREIEPAAVWLCETSLPPRA
jgi:hypothetical protein